MLGLKHLRSITHQLDLEEPFDHSDLCAFLTDLRHEVLGLDPRVGHFFFIR
jgi:hypothetical protein